MKLRKQRRAIREVSRDDDFQSDRDTFPMEVTDWAPNPEQLYWSAELRDILVNALNGLRPLLRDGLRATRYRRPFNRSDSTGAERGSHRGEGAAMASSVAASRAPEQVLQQENDL
jgi:hypothetical protein